MRTLFTFFIAVLLCSAITAQDVSVVKEEVSNGGSMYYFHARKVARSSGGLLMVVWTDLADAGGQINYSTYDNDFQTWSPAAAVSSAGDRADKPGIASDELGNIHACWQERASTDAKWVIMYSKYDGVSWATPVKVSLQDEDDCEEASIEVDSDNNIWIVYNNDGAGEPNEFVYIVLSSDGGQTWSDSATPISSSGLIDGSVTNARCALAAGPNGKLAAVWHNGLPWNSSRREISFNQYDGTNWSQEVMISDTTTADRSANWYPAVAVDSKSNIYVFYHTNDISSDPDRKRYVLVQKKGWDQSWEESVTTVIHTETAGDMLSVSAVADEDDVIHFVFRKDVPDDTTGIDGIYYTFSKDGGETWAEQTKIGRPDHDGGYVTIANKVRKEYGMDIAFREGNETLVNDPDITDIVYVNIPYDFVTEVEEIDVPLGYELLANYPNPFNPSTTIEFSVAKAGQVNLVIYDILGNEVLTLVNRDMQPGHFKTSWKGVNKYNQNVVSGVYFARLETKSSVQTIKLTLLK